MVFINCYTTIIYILYRKYKQRLLSGVVYAFTLMKENCVNSLAYLLGNII